jgi:allantoinase
MMGSQQRRSSYRNKSICEDNHVAFFGANGHVGLSVNWKLQSLHLLGENQSMSGTPHSFGLKSRNVVTPDGVKEATILVSNGKISDIISPGIDGGDYPVEDLGDLVIMPGLVDSHVHVNEPGRTEWEGFETATRAAAAGGITTIADMPLNSDPVTTTLDALKIKEASTENKLWVDTSFWGGVVPGNASALESMLQAGVRGFKCFLIHSGIDDFPNVTEADLRMAMPILAKWQAPLLVHAELECGETCTWDKPSDSYAAFLESRPRQWENEAIKLMVRLCRETKCPVHIVHLSSSEALPFIKEAKGEGLPFTVETCPHYLTFASEEIKDGDPRFKCAPPIREAENRELLWQAVKDGTIDFVVSDHSPCSPHLKFLDEGDLKKAWGGISSLQFGLSTVWTEARKRGGTISDIAHWMCASTTKFLSLDDSKGQLKKGYDADIVVWDPEEQHTIEQSNIHHRHKITPYDGRTLFGKVKRTYLRGDVIFDGTKVRELPIGEKIVSNYAKGRR